MNECLLAEFWGGEGEVGARKADREACFLQEPFCRGKGPRADTAPSALLPCSPRRQDVGCPSRAPGLSCRSAPSLSCTENSAGSEPPLGPRLAGWLKHRCLHGHLPSKWRCCPRQVGSGVALGGQGPWQKGRDPDTSSPGAAALQGQKPLGKNP